MERNEIDELLAEYKNRLLDELGTRIAYADVQAHTERMRAEIVAGVEGKNADSRKRAAAALLAENPDYQLQLNQEHISKEGMERAAIEARCYGERISLTKAWLYSQSGIGK